MQKVKIGLVPFNHYCIVVANCLFICFIEIYSIGNS